ncbi:membrane protein [Burkholderia paludis]|nr:membrane protein [Burkholderia paludis]KFG98970.1 membrane protein [Burkholderia paludis]
MNGNRSINRLWAATFMIAIASEVFSGAIRYYTSIAGVSMLGYLPKALMVGCIALGLAIRPRVDTLLVASFLAVQLCVSLANGVSLVAACFWIWTVAPLLFVLLMPRGALDLLESDAIRGAIVLLATACCAGVMLNGLVHLPWVGGSIDVDGVNVQLASSNYVGTVPRLTGFGRSSATTGLVIGLLTTWLVPRLRNALAIAALLAMSAYAIWATTNKTTLIALSLVLFCFTTLKTPGLRRACIVLTGLMIVLPIVGWVVATTTNVGVADTGSLASMQDRLFNTWPKLLEGMANANLLWFGVGPGGFGSATAYYTADFGFNTGYADNAALYVVANIGVAGGLLVMLLFAQRVLASRIDDPRAWVMLLFVLLSGVTTDIFEALGCLLFTGLAIRTLTVRAGRVHEPRRDSAGRTATWAGSR